MIPIGGAAPSSTRSIHGRSPITTATAPATWTASSTGCPTSPQLGVDAIWVSPWYPSPLADGGYDVADYRDIHPDFGTLAEADPFVAPAHDLGLRVLIDLVPNHCSDQHHWFQAALAAAPGSAERERYIFRDGAGSNGSAPPNNWPAMFGGGAWERTTDADGHAGSGTSTCSPPSSPIGTGRTRRSPTSSTRSCGSGSTVASTGSGSTSPTRWPRRPACPTSTSTPRPAAAGHHAHRHAVHEPAARARHPAPLAHGRRLVRRHQRRRQGLRVGGMGDAGRRTGKYVRPDELHTTFNFDALMCEWTAESQRNVIDLTLAATGAVGAPATWVLANHDTIRVATRYGRPITGARFTPDGMDMESFAGVGKVPPGDTDIALGRKRARAAVLLELALPGGAYVYQGDELGLEEVEDLPEDVLQDPTWERSGHTVRGRDGCRVPIPWSGTEPPFGFGSAEHPPWLPQPAHWADLTAAAQDADPASLLNLYRAALAERRRNPALGDGTLTWDDDAPDGVLSFTREPGFRCVVNFGPGPYEIPDGAEVLVSSGLSDPRSVGMDEAVWLRV